MSEEIKFEPVFGDQSLFEDAPDDAIAIRVNDYKLITYYFLTEEHLALTNSRELKAIPIIAMRRIIKTPVWTVADQQAGLLPPIGSKYLTGGDMREFTCLFHSKGNGTVSVIGFNSDDEVSGYQIQYCHPIETPAEKAQRLKSEWCAKAAKQLKNLEYTSTLTSIYDALLSGELQAPKGER